MTRPILGVALLFVLHDAVVAVTVTRTSSSLTSARAGHMSAAVYENGVIVVGPGVDASGVASMDVQVYSGGTWTSPFQFPNAGIAQVGTVAAVRPTNGHAKILVTASDSLLVYTLDTVTMQWSNGTFLSAQYRARSAAVAGPYALIAGGYVYQPTPLNSVRTVDVYNSNTGAWTTAQLSAPRYYVMGVSAGRVAVFAGGYTQVSVCSNAVDFFDSSSGQWTNTTMPLNKGSFDGALVGNKVYFPGGFLCNVNDATNTMAICDVTTKTCTAGTPMTSKRVYPSVAALGTWVFVAAGSTDSSGSVVATIEAYDTLANQWIAIAPNLPNSFYRASAVTFGDSVFVTGGGVGSGAAYADSYRYTYYSCTANEVYNVASGTCQSCGGGTVRPAGGTQCVTPPPSSTSISSTAGGGSSSAPPSSTAISSSTGGSSSAAPSSTAFPVSVSSSSGNGVVISKATNELIAVLVCLGIVLFGSTAVALIVSSRAEESQQRNTTDASENGIVEMTARQQPVVAGSAPPGPPSVSKCCTCKGYALWRKVLPPAVFFISTILNLIVAIDVVRGSSSDLRDLTQCPEWAVNDERTLPSRAMVLLVCIRLAVGYLLSGSLVYARDKACGENENHYILLAALSMLCAPLNWIYDPYHKHWNLVLRLFYAIAPCYVTDTSTVYKEVESDPWKVWLKVTSFIDGLLCQSISIGLTYAFYQCGSFGAVAALSVTLSILSVGSVVNVLVEGIEWCCK